MVLADLAYWYDRFGEWRGSNNPDDNKAGLRATSALFKGTLSFHVLFLKMLLLDIIHEAFSEGLF